MLHHKTNKKISRGRYYPLGATLDDDGVNFAIYSQNAREVYLLLFDEPDGEPTDIIKLEDRTKYIWHALVHGIRGGQLYGYKIRGDYNPAYGRYFNEHKLLIDPYARPYARALTEKATDDVNVINLRKRLIKNHICHLLLSSGTR